MGGAVIVVARRRLDKLRLLKTYPTKYWKSKWKESWGVAKDFVKSGDLLQKTSKWRTTFWTKYPGTGDFSNLRIEFAASQKGLTAAIDFTPKKLTSDEWADVRGFLDTIFGVGDVWSDFRIQVMEIAIDIEQPMSNFIFVAEGLSVLNATYLQKGTMYLGSKYGHRSFCIYDKQKQLAEEKKVQLAGPRTRIEARLRGMQVTLKQLLEIQNPFGSLLAVPRERLDQIKAAHPTDPVFSAFRSSIQKGLTGHDAYWMYSTEARKHLLKRLRPHSLKLNTSPSAHKHWSEWVQRELKYLAANLK
jgi:hypothetical protein